MVSGTPRRLIRPLEDKTDLGNFVLWGAKLRRFVHRRTKWAWGRFGFQSPKRSIQSL